MGTSGNAVGALGQAAALEKAARRRSGWYARYLTVFGGSQLLLVPAALLWHGFAAASTLAVAQVLLVGGLSAYAARQPVVRRGFGVRHGVIVGTWGLVFAGTVALGSTLFADSVPFTAVGALACALPLAVGAGLEQRRSS
ncbi:hypothetical protein [Streptomyces sp. NPDC059761]|uniref:hypothetical protein n=1 Tax=Streptomyces sp. NPDC059761 TaxID=3346937 RepID=UPI003658A25F